MAKNEQDIDLVRLGLQSPDQHRGPPLTTEEFMRQFLEAGEIETQTEFEERSTESASADSLRRNPILQALAGEASDETGVREFMNDVGTALREGIPQSTGGVAASFAGSMLRGMRGTDELLENQIRKLEGIEEKFEGVPLATFATKSLREVSEHVVSSLQNSRERLITEIEERVPRSVFLDTAMYGTWEGLTFGTENLPGIGGVIESYTTPVKERLEMEAADSVREIQMTMDTSAGEALFTGIPAFTGTVTGTLTGGYTSFLPFMRAGRWMMGVPGALRSARDGNNFLKALKAQRSVFVGDIAGSFAYGALTNVGGPVSHLLGMGARHTGILEDSQELGDDASWRDRALHSSWSRLRSALSMGAEGFAFSAILRNTAIGAFTDVPAHRKIWMESLNKWMRGRGGDASKYATLRQAYMLSQPGMRRHLKIYDPEDARIFVDLRAQDEIFNMSDDAARVLSEQAAVEGVVSYQSSVAALAAGVYDLGVKGTGNMGVLYNIPDPYRLMREVAQRGNRLDNVLQTVPVKDAPTPLVHTAREVKGDVILGYVSRAGGKDSLTDAARAVDPEMPIFLQHRPNLAASERGLVEEVLVNPSRTRTFRTWDDMTDEFGDMTRAWRELRKRNDTVIIERAAGGEPTVVVLNPEQIKSAKHVTPEAIKSMPKPQTTGEAMAREFANEPIEIAMKKILPDFNFSAPTKNADGTYNLVMWKVGSKGPSSRQLSQLKKEGFFQGQRVMYGSSQAWEVTKIRPKTLDITDPVSGETATVARRNVQALPVAQFEAEVPIDDALYREFVGFANEQINRVNALRPGAVRLREIARASQNPGHLERDMVTNNVDFIAYPSETMWAQAGQGNLRARMAQAMNEIQQTPKTPENAGRLQELLEETAFMQDRLRGLGRRAQNEKAYLDGIDIDDSTIMVPDELDYFRLTFKNFLKQQGITPSGGEFEAMQLSFMRRFSRDMWNKIPAGERRRINRLREEIIEGIESLPPSLDNKARLAGYQLHQYKQDGGTLLTRPGSDYSEGIYMTEDGINAALDRTLRYGVAPNLTPQTDWFPFAMPQAGPSGTLPGTRPTDLLVGRAGEEVSDNTIKLMAGQFDSSIPVEWTKQKPRWAIMMEEMTDLPLYTEYFNPMFQAYSQANNAKMPALTRYVEGFKGLNQHQRRELGSFIQSVEDHTTFIDKDALLAAAKEWGLNKKQIRAMGTMREVMDDHFRLGMDWYGWEPTDYIFNFFHHMLPAHQSGAPITRYGNMPKKFDIFASKKRRTGQLPDTEDDPLIVGMKYLNTFYTERFLGPHWDKMRALTKLRFGDLPPDIQTTIKSNMPRQQAARINDSDPALPSNVLGPVNEVLEYMLGWPNGASDMGTTMMKGLFNRLGVTMNDKQAKQIVDQALLMHYGAALGFRPIPVTRNTIQNLITTYTRLGGAATGQGFARTTDPQFYRKAVEEGIIPLSSRGVHFADNRVSNVLQEAPVTTEGIKGAITGGITRHVFQDGLTAKTVRKLTDKGLTGIQNTDHFNRIAAAGAQDAHLRPMMQRFINGKWSREKLVDKGLKYWEKPIKDKFLNILDNQGSEQALWYMNRQAAEATQGIYGAGMQPGWLQSPTGRTFYAYGTFSLMYKDFLFRTWQGAGWADRAKFLARMAAVNGAITGVGLEYGVDMKNWLGTTAVTNYAGGPGVDRVMDVVDFARADGFEQKSAVLARAFSRGVIGNFFPGQLFLNDLREALQQEPWPIRGLAAFTLGKPVEGFNSWHLDIVDMMDEQTPPVVDERLIEQNQDQGDAFDMMNELFQNAPGQTPDGPEDPEQQGTTPQPTGAPPGGGL